MSFFNHYSECLFFCVGRRTEEINLRKLAQAPTSPTYEETLIPGWVRNATHLPGMAFYRYLPCG